MTDPYSTCMLIKQYAWHARDVEGKSALARRLLQAALEIAESHLFDLPDLLRQLRRDIAELDYKLDKNPDALTQLTNVGDGFRVGDYLLKEGKYEEALRVYEEFHATGRFKNYWRLWRCSFLLNRFQDVVQYLELSSSESPQRIITDLEARALAVAAVAANQHFAKDGSWQLFASQFPNCAHILETKVGNLSAINLVADRWSRTDELGRLRKRIIGKIEAIPSQLARQPVLPEFKEILKKARAGIMDIPEVEQVTATTILKSLAQANNKLDGHTVVEHMAKGFIHSLILDSHRQALAEAIDIKLAHFQKAHHNDLVAVYRETILGSFGFYEVNEVSQAIKSILLAAETDVRQSSGLPPRGEGWLAESEMLRVLAQRFAPHKVLSQYSPPGSKGCDSTRTYLTSNSPSNIRVNNTSGQ